MRPGGALDWAAGTGAAIEHVPNGAEIGEIIIQEDRGGHSVEGTDFGGRNRFVPEGEFVERRLVEGIHAADFEGGGGRGVGPAIDGGEVYLNAVEKGDR